MKPRMRNSDPGYAPVKLDDDDVVVRRCAPNLCGFNDCPNKRTHDVWLDLRSNGQMQMLMSGCKSHCDDFAFALRRSLPQAGE
jgi:hypothetical protein